MNSSATLGALMNSSATLGAPMNSSATLGAEILGGGSGTAGSMADVGREAGSPMAVDGEIQSGPVILGGRTDDGPVKLGAMDSAAAGPLITGGVITSTGSLSGGGALSSATEVIPKPAAPLDDSWLDNALQSRDVDDGTDMLGAWIESDRVASLPPIGGDAPWEDGTPGSGRGHERRQRGRPGSLEPPPPPKPSGEVEERIAAAVDILHRFLIRRCKTHSLTRDMRRLHRAGAGPEPIMEELLTLVRQQANDVPEVRAAFGTIEMARTVLTRGQMLDQLQTIIRDEG
jgi:hypothetical protein